MNKAKIFELFERGCQIQDEPCLVNFHEHKKPIHQCNEKQQATKIAKISFVYGEIGFLKHMQPSLFYVAGFDAVRYPYG